MFYSFGVLKQTVEELELVMINMEDDSGMGVDEDDWDEWLLGALSRLLYPFCELFCVFVYIQAKRILRIFLFLRF